MTKHAVNEPLMSLTHGVNDQSDDNTISSLCEGLFAECQVLGSMLNTDLVNMLGDVNQQLNKLRSESNALDVKLSQYENIIRKQQTIIAQKGEETAPSSRGGATDEEKNSSISNETAMLSPRRMPRKIEVDKQQMDYYLSLEKKCKQLEKENSVLISQLQGKSSNVKLQDLLLRANQNHKREQERLQHEKNSEIQVLEKQILELKRAAKRDMDRVQRDKMKVEEQLKQEAKTIANLKKQIHDLEVERDTLWKRIQVDTKNNLTRLTSTSRLSPLPSPRQRPTTNTPT